MEANKYKAFLIDDDLQALKMLKMNFELNGFECLTSSNPIEAIEKVAEYFPDIIVSDLDMPIVNGFHFRKKLLENEKLREIPFVLLTSHDGEGNMLKGYDLDINDYVLKTESPKVVLKKIISVLHKNNKIKEHVKLKYKNEAEKLESVKNRQTLETKSLEINYLTIPYDNTPGGDFLDFIKLDESKSVVVLADVMGKKWDAWFHSFPFKSYLRSSIINQFNYSKLFNASEILSSVNSLIFMDKTLANYTIAITIIMLDEVANKMQISIAGGLPILRIKNNGAIQEIAPIECAVGLSRFPGYYSQTIDLEEGDRILTFTDGVIDVPNKFNKQLGYYEFLKLLSSYSSINNLSWIEKIIREYSENKLTDDLTLLEIKRKEYDANVN